MFPPGIVGFRPENSARLKKAIARDIVISNPSAGTSRIRFKELASRLSARATMAGHPHEMLALLTRLTTDCKSLPKGLSASAIDCGEEMRDVLESNLIQRAKRPELRMTPFFVMIKCQLGKTYQVASAIADAEIASEVYSTSGDYDLLVKFYVESDADIGHFVNEKVHPIDGIQDTKTIITFKAF